MRRYFYPAAIGLIALVILQSPLQAAASSPFAVVGAYASYTGEGGFIPYFSGVEGNITYSVSSVFDNGSMAVHVFVNITAGTDLNPFINETTVIDSVQAPKVFPAVSPAVLSTLHVTFQNVSASFSKNSTVSVPAGLFDTSKFVGKDANGTSVSFWFDRTTGLMIEESSGTSAVELKSSNIATPVGTPSFFNSEAPFELVFVVAFAVGGVLFLYLRHHYTSAASREAAKRKN